MFSGPQLQTGRVQQHHSAYRVAAFKVLDGQ
jgi:hypothetical protein